MAVRSSARPFKASTAVAVATEAARGQNRAWIALVTLPLMSKPALAHGFAEAQGTLEGTPAWLYLTSSASVVLLSFALVGWFSRQETGQFTYGQRIVGPGVGVVKPMARAVSVLLYGGVIALGLLGPDSFQHNPAPPVLTEIYWWVGYGMVAILVCDVWPIINPWKTLYEWLGEPCLDREYPARLGALPALAVFLVFAWLNMVVFAFSSPWLVGLLAFGYGLLMWVGMAVYGKDEWLWHADVFTRVFDLFGRFAPVRLTGDGIEIRNYAVGLVEDTATTRSEVLLVIAVLFALSFDGFKETLSYFLLFQTVRTPGLPPVVWNALFGGGVMVTGYVSFVGAYVGVSALVQRVAGTQRGLDGVMKRFVLTLVPIAVAYHVAHYSLYFVLQHELLIGVAVDPLPGTPIELDPGLIGFLHPAHVWYSMVALIVLGHVIAVWIAHHVALDYFETRAAAIRSQVPMLGLMVFYTVVSLWIISQPFRA